MVNVCLFVSFETPMSNIFKKYEDQNLNIDREEISIGEIKNQCEELIQSINKLNAHVAEYNENVSTFMKKLKVLSLKWDSKNQKLRFPVLLQEINDIFYTNENNPIWEQLTHVNVELVFNKTSNFYRVP